MRFVIKYFSEIIVKSRPVRKQFCKRLADNLRLRLQQLDKAVVVQRQWDKIIVTCKLPETELEAVLEVLKSTPGVGQFLYVTSFPLVSIADIAERAVELYADKINGRRFVVRVKRSGNHNFVSNDVERQVGGHLLANTGAAGVDLRNADYTVRLEVRDNTVFAVKQQYQGLGGFPLGTMGPVLSLLSGGFDSTVASFETMRRGMPTHFLFFNLGGHAHEVGVKEVAYYLWQRFGSFAPVTFISVPFIEVVAEMLNSVPASYRGVVLKRMMLRAASTIATEQNFGALVTGEAIGQVASQTLPNLGLIDAVAETLVLRPLITADKDSIIKTSRQIGTVEFAESMPEYCGVISTSPVTAGKADKVLAAEAGFNFNVLDAAVTSRVIYPISELGEINSNAPPLEIFSAPVIGSVIIDIRHPDEVALKPLHIPTNTVLTIPFFKLHKQAAELDTRQRYMLYCERGVMSKLHAAHLLAEGFGPVAVYRP